MAVWRSFSKNLTSCERPVPLPPESYNRRLEGFFLNLYLPRKCSTNKLCSTYCQCADSSLIKKENEIYLIYIKKFRRDQLQSYKCMRKGFLIYVQYDEMRKYLRIYEDAVSHSYMTLQPIPSEFPHTYIRKFDFLFYQCFIIFCMNYTFKYELLVASKTINYQFWKHT
jgi:hypothetical protein